MDGPPGRSGSEDSEESGRGAPSYQLKQLKGGLMRNAPSAIQHGAEFTETLEKWIKEGFVASPFLLPHYRNFVQTP